MVAARFDHSGLDAIQQGDTYVFIATLTDDAGLPIDLSAATFGQMVKTEPGGTLLVDLSSYWALTTDGTDGSATLTIPPAITSALMLDAARLVGAAPPMVYRYWQDFQTTIAGAVRTWWMGNWDIIQETTS